MNSEELLLRTKQRLASALPDSCTVELVGSFALGCALPHSSDVDFVVFGAGEWPLLPVTQAIQRARIAKGKVKPIQNARVPIVTYVDAQTALSVDVSFDERRDVELCAEMVRKLDAHEGARESVMQVKQWVAENAVPLTGFCVVVMVLSLRERGVQESFWDAYRDFDCSRYAITVHGIVERDDNQDYLLVVDPADEQNNLAKACHAEWRAQFP